MLKHPTFNALKVSDIYYARLIYSVKQRDYFLMLTCYKFGRGTCFTVEFLNHYNDSNMIR